MILDTAVQSPDAKFILSSWHRENVKAVQYKAKRFLFDADASAKHG